MFSGSPHDPPAGLHVLAFELISDRFPLLKSMAKELTLFPVPLLPWVSTYKSPEGREEELPQFTRNKLRAHMAASATTPPIFFYIFSPQGAPIGAPFRSWGWSAASRPKAMPCQPSRRLKLVAEIYLCIRNEREEQTRQQPESGFQPLTHPLCGWMRE